MIKKWFVGSAVSGSLGLMTLGAYASSVATYTFSENATYPVQTALGIVTQIEISPMEQVKDFSSGLSAGWELIRRDNVFYVKPKDVGVDTNLIVRTSAHNYIFELKVVSSSWKSLGEAKDQGAHYKVQFNYPDGTSFVNNEKSDSGISTEFDPKQNYFMNYEVAASNGEDWLVPLQVFDDGKFTYVHIKQADGVPTGNFPTVYGRNTRNGDDFIVNTTVTGNVIAIHGVYPYLVLRHGNLVVGLRRK